MPTPPAVLVSDVTEVKPQPKGDIVNDDTAAATYSADLESWGERLQAAGVRVCRWMAANGAAVECPR